MQKEIIRVVVASPSDVQEERDSMPHIIENLNREIADLFKLRLECYMWETDARAGLHPRGAQGIVDDTLQIEDCDLLIVIFWKRFGTLTPDGQTGTEHEFYKAYSAWEERGHPEIMVYFNQKPFYPALRTEVAQLDAVMKFKDEFPKEGFFGKYNGIDNFRELIRQHLIQFIKKYAEKTSHDSSVPFMASDLPQFTGRHEELSQLEQKLLQHQKGPVVVCSVTGIGGVGKSALAAHFATIYRNRFPDGVFWARLDTDTPTEIVQSIAKHLNPDILVPNDSKQINSTMQRLLAGKQALLILDNADGKDAAEKISYLQPSSSTVAVLVTTRNRALAAALQAFSLDLDSFSIEEGIEHFKKVLGNDHLSGEGYENIKRIIKFLGGLPLAVDLAARYLAFRSGYPLDKYCEQLRIDDLELENKSVVACLMKSMDLLQTLEKTAFISLGACSEKGFSIKTAMAVAGIESENEMRRLLDIKLYNLSMVQWRFHGRFALHPIIRAFVRTQGDIDKADRRHAEYWCDYVKKYNRDSIEDWESLTIEWDGIRTAWDWCLKIAREGLNNKLEASQHLNDCYRSASEIAFNLRYFLDGRGHWQESIERMPASLEAAKSGNISNEIEFRIRRHLAILLRKSGKNHYNEAAKYNEANIKFASEQEQEDWIGQECEQLGRVRVRQKRYDEAERLYFEALTIARKHDSKRYIGQALNCLGELYRQTDKLSDAVRHLKEAFKLYKGMNDEQGMCSSLGHIGNTYSNMGDHKKAICYFTTAISIFMWATRDELLGSLCQNLGFSLAKYKKSIEALACFVVSADISNRLGIQGWSGKSPTTERDRLFQTLGFEAQNFLISPNNNIDRVLNRARSMIEGIIAEYRVDINELT